MPEQDSLDLLPDMPPSRPPLTCSDCGESMLETYLHRGGRYLSCESCGTCDECTSNTHHHCATCGELASNRSSCECGIASCCRSICERCEHCDRCCECENEEEEERDNGPIHEYCSTNFPPAIPFRAPYKPFLYMGVELEIECGGKDRQQMARNIANEYGSEKILIKEDGSLDNGFELVTGKYSLEAHKELWPGLTSCAIRYHARSWKHKTTGLHIHLSRNWFTPLTIGKLLVFLNSSNRIIRRNVIRLAGRESPDYAALKKKKLTDALKRNSNRYEALNLNPEKTIEFRLFKGTLNSKRIFAFLEFCHALAYYVRDVSIEDLESWDKFMDYVKKDTANYKDLIEFFAIVREGATPDPITCGTVAGEQ